MSDYIPKTDEQLRELAVQLVAGQIMTDGYLAAQGDERLITSVFMPLALMSPADLKSLDDEGVAMIYEHVGKAQERAINGYPCFFSFQVLRRGEAEKLLEYAGEVEAFKTGGAHAGQP